MRHDDRGTAAGDVEDARDGAAEDGEDRGAGVGGEVDAVVVERDAGERGVILAAEAPGDDPAAHGPWKRALVALEGRRDRLACGGEGELAGGACTLGSELGFDDALDGVVELFALVLHAFLLVAQTAFFALELVDEGGA